MPKPETQKHRKLVGTLYNLASNFITKKALFKNGIHYSRKQIRFFSLVHFIGSPRGTNRGMLEGAT